MIGPPPPQRRRTQYRCTISAGEALRTSRELLWGIPPKGGDCVERKKELVLALAELIRASAEFIRRLAELLRLFKKRNPSR
jgi:hypothetical protein